MGMLGLKLRTNAPCAAAIKILRRFDPDASISNFRSKIIHNSFVYTCDCIDEDGIATLLKLLHEFETAAIGVDIYEQLENGRKTADPALLQNLLEQYKEIQNQIQEIIDWETEDELL